MNDQLPVFTLADLESVSRVQLDHFDNDDAVALGVIAASVISETGLDLAVDIVRGTDLVFRAKTGSTGAGNDEWLAGKAATARHFRQPSLQVRRRLEASDAAAAAQIDEATMRPHGGSIPIFVGDEVVATITMSGEPDVIDHSTCALAIARYVASVA